MAHALFDRRDITAQRALAEQPPPSERDELAAAVRELRSAVQIMQHQLLEFRAHVTHLCVTDREPAEAIMENWPVPGARRFIVRRTGNGGTIVLAATTPTLILPADESRLGGTIVNTAAAGGATVTLTFSPDIASPAGVPLTAGAAQILVPPQGSQSLWLGNLLWCGNVIATASAGPTTITVAAF